ncbi:hypothetical protein SmJEL517_g04432 [Synchytrium microbalum]|uniref:Complex 1 LYR protein domain-containing protein n=1 Tax=Synchytrium microbalum TaxID=1806994 RepID=A0A507BZ86_9FUNG|nr:uncharacterized protein SmJEL517_g04432 [Synchytrium microbalum]TPX32441.1 hypothetical protein SmJEL517_g04432 [Synchytrium microbalum]
MPIHQHTTSSRNVSSTTQSSTEHTPDTELPLYTPSKHDILALYRSLLRTARQYKSYNISNYIRIRSKEAFHSNASEADQNKIASLYANGIKELEIAKRQAYIQNVFSLGPLVVEMDQKERRR